MFEGKKLVKSRKNEKNFEREKREFYEREKKERERERENIER